jgi:hypothetical protein
MRKENCLVMKKLPIFLYICTKYVFAMKIKQQYQVRNIAGENVVIMQGRYGVDMTQIITLNDSALTVWNGVAGRDFSVEDVVEVLQQNYEVDAATARHDSELWVARMKECNLVEE